MWRDVIELSGNINHPRYPEVTSENARISRKSQDLQRASVRNLIVFQVQNGPLKLLMRTQQQLYLHERTSEWLSTVIVFNKLC